MTLCEVWNLIRIAPDVEWNDSLMTITLAQVHYDAGQALGVWDFRTLDTVKQCKTSGANMRIVIISRITSMEAHVPPMEKLRLFSYIRKGKSFWRCLFTFSSMEELHLF